ncbi:hypothetical protein FOPG_19832, partial [Fusarium oxysporum f. sp. conglutinans race 2 54008]
SREDIQGYASRYPGLFTELPDCEADRSMSLGD